MSDAEAPVVAEPQVEAEAPVEAPVDAAPADAAPEEAAAEQPAEEPAADEEAPATDAPAVVPADAAAKAAALAAQFAADAPPEGEGNNKRSRDDEGEDAEGDDGPMRKRASFNAPEDAVSVDATASCTTQQYWF